MDENETVQIEIEPSLTHRFIRMALAGIAGFIVSELVEKTYNKFVIEHRHYEITEVSE